jgi:hypothetical protein
MACEHLERACARVESHFQVRSPHRPAYHLVRVVIALASLDRRRTDTVLAESALPSLPPVAARALCHAFPRVPVADLRKTDFSATFGGLGVR